MRLPSKYLRIYDKFLSWLRSLETQSELLDNALKIIESSKNYARTKIEESRDKSVTAEKLEALGPTAANFLDLEADRKYVTSVPEVTIVSSNGNSSIIGGVSSIRHRGDDSDDRCLYLFSDVLVLITRKKKGKRVKPTIKECFTLAEIVLLREKGKTNTNELKTIKMWYDKVIYTITLNTAEERDSLWFDLGTRTKFIAPELSDPIVIPTAITMSNDLVKLVESEGRSELGVPLIVENSCRYLSKHLDMPGLFRVAGSREISNGVFRIVESDPLHRIPLKSEPYMVAYVLKTFLQKLTTPLATAELHDDYVELATFESEMVMMDPEGRKDSIAREAAVIYERMPFVNLQTYLLVVDLLAKIAEKSALNTMPAKNLAGIFTPNIFGCKGADNKEFTDTQKLTHLMQILIELHFDVKERMTTKQTITL